MRTAKETPLKESSSSEYQAMILLANLSFSVQTDCQQERSLHLLHTISDHIQSSNQEAETEWVYDMSVVSGRTIRKETDQDCVTGWNQDYDFTYL